MLKEVKKFKTYPMSKTLVFVASIISFIALLSFTSRTESTGVNWMTIEEAIEAQSKNPRPIMIDVYTKWCGPCKMMSNNTFTDSRVIEYLNKNYYCVKFDAESPDTVSFQNQVLTNPDYKPNTPGRNGVHEFARMLNISSYPTLFFMDEKAMGLGPIVGYRTPAQLETFLHFFAEKHYLKVRTQEEWIEYEKNFKVTWN
jgi:thioredoxin-related protein